MGTAVGPSSFDSSVGASWGAGGKTAGFGKVGEDAHHLQVIWDVKLKVVNLKRVHGGREVMGKKRDIRKEAEKQKKNTNKPREGEREELRLGTYYRRILLLLQ